MPHDEGELSQRIARLEQENERLRSQLAALSTDRRRASEAMRETNARLTGIVDSAMDAIVSVDEAQRIVVFNAAAERIFGYDAEEAFGQPLSMLIPERFHASHEAHVWGFGETGVTSRKAGDLAALIAKRKDGTEFPIEASISQATAEGQRLYTVILRDVTGRVEAEEALHKSEEQLRQAQRMEAVGRLAGGVAHDFNNLLTVISGYASFALVRLHDADPVREYIVQVAEAANRAAALTRQLLAFSRKQIAQPRVFAINDVVANLNRMLERLVGEDVDLKFLPGERVGNLRMDPSQLEQVIANLTVNARDAMPQGGRLTIETELVEVDEDRARRHGAVRPGTYVQLSVSDTGVGMDEATLEYIFEPFFTTKPTGKGTGLGLSTVYGIVQQAGGFVWVYSEVGRGSSFKLFLPAVDDAGDRLQATVLPAGANRGTERVLLVEDEEGVRTLARDSLEFYGYQVLEARSGEEAIGLCERDGEQIDLLLTDVVMPMMSGPQLAERLVELRPAMRVLYMSGYTEDTIVHHGVLDEGIHLIEKPFTPDLLAAKVRSILDA